MWSEWRARWRGIAEVFGDDLRGVAGVSLLFLPIGVMLIWLESLSKDPGRLAPTIVYVLTTWSMFIFPIIAGARHHWRQARAMDKIRASFALGLEALNSGQARRAQRYLLSVERWERHWKLGNSWLYRSAYSASVIAFTGFCGVLHYIMYYSTHRADGLPREKTLGPIETVLDLAERPILFSIILVIGCLWGMSGVGSLRHIREANWREFYSQRLRAALNAGRSIGTAKPLEEIVGVSARELFGLDDYFTKAQLRKSWLRLARELHPDRWMHADAVTRAAKEAALKRVNAAKDALEREARG